MRSAPKQSRDRQGAVAESPETLMMRRHRVTPSAFVRFQSGIDNWEQGTVAPSEEVADDVVRFNGSAGLDVAKHRGGEGRACRGKHGARPLREGLAGRGPVGCRNGRALLAKIEHEDGT